MWKSRRLTGLRDDKCDKPTGSDNGDPDSPSLDGVPLSVDRLLVENLEKDRATWERLTIGFSALCGSGESGFLLVTREYRIPTTNYAITQRLSKRRRRGEGRKT